MSDLTITNKRDRERTRDVLVDDVNVSFSDLQLSKQVVAGLRSASFYRPSPVQLKAIPLGKIGLDLIVQAKSGTGKTCVFSVIALEHILTTSSKALQVLVLAPTREVATQICGVLQAIGANLGVKACAFIGGQPVKEDKLKLKSCQIAVGTPGRILHLITENLLPTANIRMFILDEADKLLAPEFQDDINLVYSKLPDNKQMLALSATYPAYMATYVTRYMRDATFVRLNKVDPSLRGIKQYFKITPYSSLPNKSFDSKVTSLISLLSSLQFQQCIVFINYQLKAENLCKSLTSKGWPAIFISGNIEQSERNQAINQLKTFKCRILVSTDLTARGIDAENVDLIICMDLASDPETYLHRIGRAGRYGCQGTAVSFVCEKDEASMFETIIDSYSLRITEFGDDLNDVISVRNESDDVARVDDVTIEKVQLSKEELDQSLFEYEQFRNARTKPAKHENQSKPQFSVAQLTDSRRLNELVSTNILENLEKSLSMFTERTGTEISRVQEEYRQLALGNCLNISEARVEELSSKFQQALKCILIDDRIGSDTPEFGYNDVKPTNLSDMYRWEPVTESVADDLLDNQENAVACENEKELTYAFYYEYYYKSLLKQFLPNK